MRRLLILLSFSFIIASCSDRQEATFNLSWDTSINRIWAGPEVWTNRLQDWEVSDGKLKCLYSGNNRNAYLLTTGLDSTDRPFSISLKSGFLNKDTANLDQNFIGVRLGVKGQFDDYRDAAVHGKGIDVGITQSGIVFVGSPEEGTPLDDFSPNFELQINGKPSSKGGYFLEVNFRTLESEELITILSYDTLSNQSLSGGIALVSHFSYNKDTPASWFSDVSIGGERLQTFPERAFGPVLFTQYTLSRNTLKMTAQMPPVGNTDSDSVILEIQQEDGQWSTIGQSNIDPESRTAHYKIDEWESKQDIPFRLKYDLRQDPESFKTYYYEGTVRKDPVDQETVKVAAFTGNNDLGFPNNDLIGNVLKHDPDFIFFSGDQIYEGVGGYGVQRSPIDKSTLDYLRKWYLYGWSNGVLFRDRPVVAIPDDHDVYHGNIWGEAGKATGSEGTHFNMQDRGGYKQPAQWVNMVQRTQTSHLPDPFDPTPVKQGISVYYTDIVYGGISFAVIEDRKWKSAPQGMLPRAQINNGWIQNPEFDPVTEADIPGAVLLGDRQLDFLEHWAGDWTDGAIMKAVLSQTIFANVATLPRGERHDNIVPKLRILEKGEYAEDDYPVADMDSNGWPQTGRNKALRKMRKASAFHIAGDQHLGSTIQYGIDDYRDGPFAICVPSISNVWPRRWYPPEPGLNREEGAPQYTGDFKDGFGNRMTVLAVSNPVFTGREPSRLYDRATGYGIIEFNKTTRQITAANWERDIDPTVAGNKPYDGWPITVSQFDNDGREAVAHLPQITTTGLDLPPVIKVSQNGELVYAVRSNSFELKPAVYGTGTFELEIGEPGTEKWQKLEVSTSDTENITLEF